MSASPRRSRGDRSGSRISGRRAPSAKSSPGAERVGESEQAADGEGQSPRKKKRKKRRERGDGKERKEREAGGGESEGSAEKGADGAGDLVERVSSSEGKDRGSGERRKRKKRRKRKRDISKEREDEDDAAGGGSPCRATSDSPAGSRIGDASDNRKRRKTQKKKDSEEEPDDCEDKGSNDASCPRSRRRKRKGKPRRADARRRRDRDNRNGTRLDKDGEEGKHGGDGVEKDTENDSDGDGSDGGNDSEGAKRRARRRRGRAKRRLRRRRRSRDGSRSSRRSRSGGERRHGSRRRSVSGRRGHRRGRRGPAQNRPADSNDKRPMVERVKGGVKLFVGRLPLEATQAMMMDAFGEYGEVLEVFLIDSSRATSGARCAFVRIGSLESAEKCVAEMHEQRILVPERRELGPVQVAFAKGEATRFGLDPGKEQLPARWQVPAASAISEASRAPAVNVDPESMGKEALVSLIKEGQRSGGQPFKGQWWAYCDSGKGGVQDYDPKRHSMVSLRQFVSAAQQGEWGGKPWFRRALNWAVLGGRGNSRPRRRHHGSSSSSSSSSSSRSSSNSLSAKRRQAERRRRASLLLESYQGPPAGPSGPGALPLGPPGLAPPLPSRYPISGPGRASAPGLVFAGSGSTLSLEKLLRGAPVPPSAEPPPPPPGDEHKPAPPKPRLLAPATQRHEELEAFLAKYRISPSTSFLMLKLTRDQASAVVTAVEGGLEDVAEPKASHDIEDAVLACLKRLGVRTKNAGGGSWTTVERTGSPLAVRTLTKDSRETLFSSMDAALSSNSLTASLSVALPSLDGILGPLTSVPKLGADKEKSWEAMVIPDDDDRLNVNEEAELPKSGTVVRSDNASMASVPVQPPTGARVFVKNLDKSTSERDIRELFGRHGTVLDIEIPRDLETGLGKGHAYVTLEKGGQAEVCVKVLNFTKPWGRALVVERRPGPDEEIQAAAEDGASTPQPRGASKTDNGSLAESRGDQSDDDGKPKPKPRQRPAATRKKAGSGTSRSRSNSSSHSSGGSSGDSSRWSRYTVGSRRRSRASRRRPDRSRSYSSSESYSACTSDGNARGRTSMRGGMSSMGWPPFPGMMPPGMMPPGMPPWGMPWMPPPGMMSGGMPPFDEFGFPMQTSAFYDADAAEMELAKAEKKAKREQEEREKHQVWEDHPARQAQQRQRRRSDSRSRRRPRSARSARSTRKSRPKRRASLSSSSRSSSSTSSRSSRRRKPGDWPLASGSGAVGLARRANAERFPAAGKPDSDLEFEVVDRSRLEAEINFADI